MYFRSKYLVWNYTNNIHFIQLQPQEVKNISKADWFFASWDISRISDSNMAIKSQLHYDYQVCEYFSIALDESCDIQDKLQLAIFARFISNDCLIKKEFLNIFPLKDRQNQTDRLNPWHRCERSNDGCNRESKSAHSKTNCNNHGWSAIHDRICERTCGAVQS